MRLRLATFWLLLFAAGTVGTLLSTSPAPAQVRFRVAEVAEIENLISRGRKLEVENRWSEALSLYEEALRENPDNAEVQQHFDVARLHYDLGRRYNDNSFVNCLASMNETDAVDLYAEVMLKIQSHHVDVPHWSELFNDGATSLREALADPTFVNHHHLRPTAAQLSNYESQTRDIARGSSFATRHDLRDAVRQAALAAQSQVGVPFVAAVFEYLCGVTNSLDHYTAFLTGDQLDEVYNQIDGSFVGLGIEIRPENGALEVVRVIPGSPAEFGGMHEHDRIVAVDGQKTADLNTDQAANLLQGPEGSVVEVTLQLPDRSARRVRMRRAQVEVPSVEGVQILDSHAGIGYLKISSFQKTTSRELDAALWKLHGEASKDRGDSNIIGMRGLVVDVRGNPGGLLDAAVEVADKFIEAGVIVSTRGRNPEEQGTYSAHRNGTWRVPLAVLIDGDSASASEIFAGAIRDHHRGTIIGTRSYGKGSVQGIFPMGRVNAGLRLTTAKFYSPNGLGFSHVGVSPDVLVHNVARPVIGEQGGAIEQVASDPVHSTSANASGDDPCLTTALTRLRNASPQRYSASLR
ncbi:MAG: PDZ domain-containing protein [Planctomycetales bacterium]|nr:PDZ domain-containing protein [Planctomycetales bacterium]